MPLRIVIILLAWCLEMELGSCVTHWRVTDLGRIEYSEDSAFTLIRPYDLASFIKQADRLRRLHALKDLIQAKDNEAKYQSRRNAKTVGDFQDAFYASDPDCQQADKPLAKFSFYESHYIPWSAHGFFMAKESLEVPRSEVKYNKRPFCDGAILPFTMGNFEHLQGIQAKENMNMIPELELVNKVLVESQDFYGHMVHVSLSVNASSWIFQTMAAYYFRIKGDYHNSIKCLQRAVHYVPRHYYHLPAMSLANLLQRTQFLNDSLAVALSAIGSRPEDSEIAYYIGNIYVTLNELELGLKWFERSGALDKYNQETKQKKHALACHLKLERFLEDQHTSLQERLDKLKDYQAYSDEWLLLSGKLELDRSSRNRKEYTRRAYEKFMNRKSTICDWKENGKQARLSCKVLPVHFSFFPYNNQTMLPSYAKSLLEIAKKTVNSSENDANATSSPPVEVVAEEPDLSDGQDSGKKLETEGLADPDTFDDEEYEMHLIDLELNQILTEKLTKSQIQPPPGPAEIFDV